MANDLVPVPCPHCPCPRCQRELKVRPKYLGQHVSCKYCGHAFKTPAFVPVPCPECGLLARIGAQDFDRAVGCKQCGFNFRPQFQEGQGPPPVPPLPGVAPPAAAPPAPAGGSPIERILKTENEALEKRVKALEAELTKQRAAPPADVADLRRELDDAHRDLERLRAYVQSLYGKANQAEQLETRVRQLEGELNAARTRLENLEGEIGGTPRFGPPGRPDPLNATSRFDQPAAPSQPSGPPLPGSDSPTFPLPPQQEGDSVREDSVLEKIWEQKRQAGALPAPAAPGPGLAALEQRCRGLEEENVRLAQERDDARKETLNERQAREKSKALLEASRKGAEQQTKDWEKERKELKAQLEQERQAQARAVEEQVAAARREWEQQQQGLVSERDEARAQIEAARRQAEERGQAWEAERQALQDELEQQRQALARLRTEHQQQLDEQLAAGRQQLEQQQQALARERDAVQSLLEAARQEAERGGQALRQHYERQYLEVVRKSEQRLERERSRLQAEVQRERERLDAARHWFDRDRQTVEAYLSQLRGEITALGQQREEAYAQMESLRRDMDERSIHLRMVPADIGLANGADAARLQELEQQMQDAQRQADALRRERDNARGQVEAFLREAEERGRTWDGERQELRRQVEEQRQAAARPDLRPQLEAAEGEARRLAQELDAARHAAEQRRQDEGRAGDEQRQAQEQEAARLRDENEAMRQQLDRLSREAEQRFRSWEEQRQALRVEWDQQRQALALEQQQLEEVRRQMAEERRSWEEWAAQAEKLEEELESKHKEIRNLWNVLQETPTVSHMPIPAEGSELALALQIARTDVERLQEELHEAHAQLELQASNAERLSRLVKELNAARAERDRLQQERLLSAQQVERLNTRLTQLEQALAEARKGHHEPSAGEDVDRVLQEARGRWEEEQRAQQAQRDQEQQAERIRQEEQRQARQAEHERHLQELRDQTRTELQQAEERQAEAGRQLERQLQQLRDQAQAEQQQARERHEAATRQFDAQRLILEQENSRLRNEIDALRREVEVRLQPPPADGQPPAAPPPTPPPTAEGESGGPPSDPFPSRLTPESPATESGGEPQTTGTETTAEEQAASDDEDPMASAVFRVPPVQAAPLAAEPEEEPPAQYRSATASQIRKLTLPAEVRPAETEAAPGPVGLSAGHFRRIAVNGFGDGRNTYAWCCAWYDNHVYIGTNRHLLVMIKKRVLKDQLPGVWPVPTPESDRELDLRAQVWRYSPRDETWERVYRSPMTKGLGGRDVPVASGFRNMGVFQGKSDPRLAIYTIPGCGSYGKGPVLLRCIDGAHFEPASEPGLGLGDPNVITYRGVVPFKGRLHISPSGSRGGQSNSSFNCTVYCTDDPVRGDWKACNPEGFGDPTNHGVFDIGVCGDYLYVGTINIRQGAQLWRTKGDGPPPYRWEKVLDHGADRGQHNQIFMSFAEFKGDLYVGTGIQNGGNDRQNNVGPDAGEVLRIRPDKSWDLVMGQPRMTRWGLKVPTSGLGPGFDNPFAGYIWRMRAHDGALYVGTYDSMSFLPYMDQAEFPEWVGRLFDRGTIERLMEARGGCEVWRTTDGDHWVAVTRNGFGNRFNYGVRALLSTPVGLFIGTANPYGPKVAVQGAAGWRYEDNPHGGVEVWHGAKENAGCGDLDSGGADHVALDPWHGDDGSLPYDQIATLVSADNVAAPDRSDRSEASLERGDLLAGLAKLVPIKETVGVTRQHDVRDVAAEQRERDKDDPLLLLHHAEKDLVGLAEDLAKELDTYYSGDDFRNVGYWRDKGMSPRQACQQLLEELWSLLPPTKAGTQPLQCLAVGPGVKGLVRRLLRRSDAAVTALLLDTPSGKPARPDGPDVRVLDASPAHFPVAPRSMDLVVWVEGPSAADRAAGLREVQRVLKPGGQFLAADLIGRRVTRVDEDVPLEADTARLIKEYERTLEQAELTDARIIDVTREGWLRFARHSRDYFLSKMLFQQIEREQHEQILAALPGGGLAVEAHLLVVAMKPWET